MTRRARYAAHTGCVLWLLTTCASAAAAEEPLAEVVSLGSGEGALGSTRLAQEIRAALGRRGIRTLAEPTGPNATAVEEITSHGRAAGVQVSVAIRLVPAGGVCVTARTPPAITAPQAPAEGPSGVSEFVKQADLAERYRASAGLARHLGKLGRPCMGSADWKATYFLSEAAGATVVLEVSGVPAGFGESAADAIKASLSERGHRTGG